MWQVIFILLLGVVAGTVITRIRIDMKTVDATFIIDTTSNPDKDIYRLDISRLDNITNKKWMLIKIENDANLSQ